MSVSREPEAHVRVDGGFRTTDSSFIFAILTLTWQLKSYKGILHMMLYFSNSYAAYAFCKTSLF